MVSGHVSSDEIRSRFSSAMSKMYRHEVPQYDTLLGIVEDINSDILNNKIEIKEKLQNDGSINRLNVERHGAIRLGSPSELNNCRRLFAIMGMRPVGYYDLSVAGVPVHSTAFRPTNAVALERNPFRIFTSLLRIELIEDSSLRRKVEKILNLRSIFSKKLINMVDSFEKFNELTSDEADLFVEESINAFRWHQDTPVSRDMYEELHREHPLIADVVYFRGPHINHLTPRTLDIDRVQSVMQQHGITPKAIIEGPPKRKVPILLRQTSFVALNEEITFMGGGEGTVGTHTARFGEIEQRGGALTPKGRDLYDSLIEKAKSGKVDEYSSILKDLFRKFPDDEVILRREGLAFFQYKIIDNKKIKKSTDSLQELIDTGSVEAIPITYEDFLPISAAGIFHSNLNDQPAQTYSTGSARDAFEKALGCGVLDEMVLYEKIQNNSIESIEKLLGRRLIDIPSTTKLPDFES